MGLIGSGMHECPRPWNVGFFSSVFFSQAWTYLGLKLPAGQFEIESVIGG